ncbi:MAG: immunoglobulin-like domain-containing protein [Myxococcota bacterium]
MNCKTGPLATLTALSLAVLVAGCGDEPPEEAVIAPGDGSQEDVAPPVITLNGNSRIEVVYGAVFEDLGARAIDDVDGEVTVTMEGDLNTMSSGSYRLSYVAIDSAGNPASASREVVVLEDEDLSSSVSRPTNPLIASTFFDGRLCGADYWSMTPQILSAGLGFSDIIGVAEPRLTEDVVRAAGGAWNQDIQCGTDLGDYTSTSIQSQVAQGYIMRTPYGELKDGATGIDGLPIVFSWPVDTRSIDLDDFQVTMNTGDIVRPLAVSSFPNFECNERNTVPIFGEFGNRLPSDHPDTRYPVIVRIVGDLILVGPGGAVVNARGLHWENTTSPYDENNGPRFVGAKLNQLAAGTMEGEGIVGGPAAAWPPNDARALYGDEADFMVRTLSTGGVSPNGVSGVKPTDFERFFRLHAVGEDGSTVVIDRVGETYDVRGGTLRVLGLSDLGQPESPTNPYDDCYDEDLDNQIDIILAGDEAAARSLTFLEVPSLEGGYGAFYNPGGPGRTPFEGVSYTQPGPSDLEPVIIALDDPMRVSFDPDGPPAEEESRTLDVEGVTRQYLLTVPASYSGDEAVPLLFNFHGLGGNARQQLDDSGLSDVAEREGFILVTPQGVDGVWTVTGFPIGNGADDFGFITALIEELAEGYVLDRDRVYATGMSQGGFLSFDLACRFSETFAAIAPVSGVMTPAMTQTCAPARPVPVMQTHGTDDAQIAYTDAQSAVQWWVQFNGVNPTPMSTPLPDTFPDNGTTVDRLVYANDETGVDVVHLRIEGGGHVWPGSDGDSDIDFAQAIWTFLSRYDMYGPVND